MKILSLVVLLAFAGWAFTKKSTAVKMDLSLAQSKIDWAATKKTGYHNGIIKLKGGDVQVDGGKLVGGKFTIDVTSINSTDFENPTDNGLIKHVLSKDFLEAEKYPEATFEITKVDYKNEKDVNITGNLTMKGLTLPLMFPAIVNSADEKRFFAYGHFNLDRTLWGVNYDVNRASKDVNLGVYILASAPQPAK